MMTVGDVPKGKIESYYMVDNYYFQKTEHLEVYGSGVDRCALENGISEDEIAQLTKDRKTVAKDLTLSAPKSVSLEYALGDETKQKAIVQAHTRAVKSTLNYAQNSGMIHYEYKVGGVKKKGEAHDLVFAMTQHDVSRECDPQLHTHCLLLNAGHDKLGNNRAIDYYSLMKNQEQLGNVYRHELAKEMIQLGYELRVKTQDSGRGIAKNYFELSHVDEATIQKFSTRDAQIREWQKINSEALNTKDYSPEQIKQIAFYKTRKKKEAVDPKELRQFWHEKAQSVNYSANRPINQSTNEHRDKHIDAIYSKVRDASFDKGMVTTRHELLKQVQVEALKGGKVFPLEEFNTRFEADTKLLQLTKPTTKPYHAEVTSLDHYRAEKRILELVDKGREAHAPISKASTMALKAWQKREQLTLDPDQAKSAELILGTKDFAVVIQGHAGTGKTTMLRAVNDVAKENKQRVLGLAPTGQAAKNLEGETGIESKTIDSFLKKVHNAELIASEQGSSRYLNHIKNSTVLVDEASMVDLKKMEHLFDVAEKHNMKVALIGDRFQFNPVGSGKPFMLIQDNSEASRGIIKEIRRQATPELRSVSESLALKHDIPEAFEKLQALSQKPESGVIFKEIASNKERFSATVNDYLDKSTQDKKTFIMTGNNKAREAFNTEVRSQLKASGRLGGEDARVQILTGRNEPREIGVAKGERLIFTQNETALYDVRNGTTGTVEQVGLDKKGQAKSITVALDDGRKIKIDPHVYNKFEHAYSITFHKAQGQTVKSAIVSLNSKERLSFNKVYVALTRHKEQISVYADDFKKVASRAKEPEVKQSAYEIHKSRNSYLPKDERLDQPYTTQRHDPSARIEHAGSVGQKQQQPQRVHTERLKARVKSRAKERAVDAVIGPEGRKVVKTYRNLRTAVQMLRALRSVSSSPASMAMAKGRANAINAYATQATMRALESVPYLGTAIKLIRIVSDISNIAKNALDHIPVIGLARKIG